MAQNDVILTVSDGTLMHSYTARPPGNGPFPGLIVFQEAFGVNHHIRDVVDRFAREGYIAIAPELFHRTAPPGFEGSYTDFTQVAPHMQALSVAGMEADIRASWEWVQRQAGLHPAAIACIGYCLGGRMAFLANSILPFKAAVSYYGGRIAPELIPRAPSLAGPMLFFWGGLDKHIPAEQIAAITAGLRQGGKPFVNVEMSDADHGFFCDERASFNAPAAAESWALTLTFLREKLR
jgi:carboxymethylenebutenolidase